MCLTLVAAGGWQDRSVRCNQSIYSGAVIRIGDVGQPNILDTLGLGIWLLLLTANNHSPDCDIKQQYYYFCWYKLWTYLWCLVRRERFVWKYLFCQICFYYVICHKKVEFMPASLAKLNAYNLHALQFF